METNNASLELQKEEQSQPKTVSYQQYEIAIEEAKAYKKKYKTQKILSIIGSVLDIGFIVAIICLIASPTKELTKMSLFHRLTGNTDSRILESAARIFQNLPDHKSWEDVDRSCFSPRLYSAIEQAIIWDEIEYTLYGGGVMPSCADILCYWYTGNGDPIVETPHFAILSKGYHRDGEMSVEVKVTYGAATYLMYLSKSADGNDWLLEDWVDNGSGLSKWRQFQNILSNNTSTEKTLKRLIQFLNANLEITVGDIINTYLR